MRSPSARRAEAAASFPPVTRPEPRMTTAATSPPRKPQRRPAGAWLARLGPQMRTLFGKVHRAVIAGGGANVITDNMTDPDPQRYLDPEVLARVGLSPMLA